MPPFFGNITDTLAVSFGGASSIWGVLLTVFTAQAFGLGVYMATRNMSFCLISTGVALLVASFMGFVPIWICFVFFATGGAFVMLPVFLGVFQNEGKEIMQASKPTSKLDTRNPRELILRIEKSSQKWAEYHNNLEGLLGIKTVDYTGDGIIGLDLDVHGMLYISRGYDWYIADKMPDEDIFKIVGLHKKDASKNLVYLLGKNKETGQPFLTSISSAHLEDSIEKCMDAKKENETNGLMVGLMMSAIGSAMFPSLVKGIVDGANTKGGNQ